MLTEIINSLLPELTLAVRDISWRIKNTPINPAYTQDVASHRIIGVAYYEYQCHITAWHNHLECFWTNNTAQQIYGSLLELDYADPQMFDKLIEHIKTWLPFAINHNNYPGTLN